MGLWDACIRQSQNPLVYGLSWYLNVVTNNKWDALIWNNYESVMPLCYNRKWGLHYIYPPLFAQQLGIFSKEILPNNVLDDFLKHIPTKFKYVEMNLPLLSKGTIPPIIDSISTNINIELDLSLKYEELYQNYSTNLKRNLKKIDSEKLKFDQEVGLFEVVELFKNNKGLEYPDMGETQYKTLIDLNLAAGNHQQSWCVGVRKIASSQILAGALFITSPKSIVFLFSGVSETGRQQKAMFYLLDQVIKMNAEQGLILDFEGSNNIELARFYRGFGGLEKKYIKIKINKLPQLFRWIKNNE